MGPGLFKYMAIYDQILQYIDIQQISINYEFIYHFFNAINWLINGITRLMNGLPRLINGWEARPLSPAAATGPWPGPQPLTNRVRPLIHRFMPLINRLMP